MLKNISLGIKAYFGAFSLISKLKLWKFFVIPMLISFLTAIAIFGSAYGLSDNIVDYLTSVFPSWNQYEWIKTTFRIIAGLIIIVIGLILFKHIIMALSAPFMSPVSEKIEAHLTGSLAHNHRNTTFMQQLWRGIKINGRNLLMELLLTIPILLLKFIPIVNIFSTILLFLVQAYYAGFGNMDYTLERHFKYRESVKFVQKHRGLAIGNGIVFMLMLLIPVVGFILVLPLSVTAATLKTVDALQLKNNLPNHA
ncbi:EI24 domain-containing protein [Flaviramulus sp. BrNp1-15]|uniref:EI24 domain-containing protein n=1 Tax=Flaviramulus sp. BrNp1-15 TaxID=2916754 RepID=UPI001EE8BD88|nr:EI24 domain-containing protein [Flaviramulus sp. BrNp1-15]ULC59816.1 EI24 domain-containing protein [Flaviramulus sp. BrNp1-15]